MNLDERRKARARYWNLLWEMTRCEFKLRDQGTALGFLWTLLNPALQFVVMYQIFAKWMGHLVDNYAFYLIVGIVQWGFFANATSSAVQCLHAKAGMAQNFNFRREILVFSSVAVVLWSHLLELSVLLVFLALGTRMMSLTWLYLPVLIVIQVLWVVGLSLFLAQLSLRFRDVGRVWAILMQVGSFAVPIFYPMKIIMESKRFWLMLNPLVHIMDGMRSCLLRAQIPPTWIVLSLLSGGALLTAWGLRSFRSQEGFITDYL
jgi:ABC-2 type transport system permease protein